MVPAATPVHADQNAAKAMVSALAFESFAYLSLNEWSNDVSDGVKKGIHSPPARSNTAETVPIVSPEEEEEDDDGHVFFDAVEYSVETRRIVESIRGDASTPIVHRHDGQYSHHEHHHDNSHEHHQSPPPLAAQGDAYVTASPRQKPIKQPAPPEELPLRFLRAGKGDPVEGKRRYEQTLAWRKEHGMDDILFEPHPNFELIRQNFFHYYHLRGHKNEPVYYEFPPKTNLKALRAGGVGLDGLLRHYAMVNEFGWQYVERDDLATSIYIIDLKGMRAMDFVGEVVDFVRKASAFTRDHYPERAGTVMVVNVPSWFKIIWNVVKPMVDEVTLKKIFILRGKDEIRNALLERIPIENIPPEYGGQSMPLGESPEERLLWNLINHNNTLACGEGPQCNGLEGQPPCSFCSFVRARSY